MFASMLRRHAPLLLAATLLLLVVTAYIVRTGPSRQRSGYRNAPAEKHKKHDHRKHKHKKHHLHH